MIKKITRFSLILLFWIFLWQMVAMIIGKELLFPTPIAVFARFFEFLGEKEFYKTISLSILRIVLGSVIAIVLGVLLAILSQKFKLIYDIILPIMTVIKSTPVASFIILLMLWSDRNFIPALISLLIVLPVVWHNLCCGIKSTDVLLLEMSKVYNMSPAKKISKIYIPSVLPYFISAIKSSLGLSWKAGVAAEILALPALSIGKQIFYAKINLETIDLFAWTFVVILLSIIIELLFVFVINKCFSMLLNSYGKSGEAL